jgi:hypothetical protein
MSRRQVRAALCGVLDELGDPGAVLILDDTGDLEAGTPAAWCTADEFYGGDRELRRDLQARSMGYVLAVA